MIHFARKTHAPDGDSGFMEFDGEPINAEGKKTFMIGIKWDYHTHTIYSRRNHGKGTIEENVQAAIQKGLQEIAISDHGPGHVVYGVMRGAIQEMRQEIQRLQGKYSQIKIHLSVEANIIDRSGALDVTKEEQPLFDFIMAGYHYGAFGQNPVRDAGLHIKNWTMDKFRTTTQGMRRENTELIIKAIYENPIKILTHPGDKSEIDITEVAKACSDRGTWMEVNNSHPHLSVEALAEAAEQDVTFVIGSDAHRPERVGSFQNALGRIEASGIDKKRVVNLYGYGESQTD